MSVLMSFIGGIVFIALLVRGAVGFYNDYQTKIGKE